MGITPYPSGRHCSAVGGIGETPQCGRRAARQRLRGRPRSLRPRPSARIAVFGTSGERQKSGAKNYKGRGKPRVKESPKIVFRLGSPNRKTHSGGLGGLVPPGCSFCCHFSSNHRLTMRFEGYYSDGQSAERRRVTVFAGPGGPRLARARHFRGANPDPPSRLASTP